MRSREDMAWAAGLFEGEGCFTFADRPRPAGRRGRHRALYARVVMADRDVVERFCRVLGIGRVSGPYQRGRITSSGTMPKPMWTWCANGFEDVQATIAMLWSWLGERRRSRAKEVLEWARRHLHDHSRCRRGHLYDAANTYTYAPTGKRECRTCRRAHEITRQAKRRAA